jgi:ABC-type polar amino acid transport system ATPase subunit
MNPEILLLDEVTSALDPERGGEVLNVIRMLATKGDLTILMGRIRRVLHENSRIASASSTTARSWKKPCPRSSSTRRFAGRRH